MTLVDAKEGQWLVVESTQGDEVTLHALRFGIEAGSVVQVQRKIPGGPVIIAKNQLEIAIGRQIAALIYVVPRAASK